MSFHQIHSKDRKSLAKLGLNVSGIFVKQKGKKTIYPVDVIYTVAKTIEYVSLNNEEIYYDICDSRFYKKETLLKGIWTCKNNIYPSRLITLMKEEPLRNALLERLRMIEFILTTTFTYD